MTEDEARAAETLHRAIGEPYSAEVVRRRIAEIPTSDRCDPKCRTWFVDGESLDITRCDDCWWARDDPLTDADMAQLPEARAERAGLLAARHAERRARHAARVLRRAWASGPEKPPLVRKAERAHARLAHPPPALHVPRLHRPRSPR